METVGGLPKLINILLCDATPRLGNLAPTEIDLGVDEVDVVANGTIVPIAQYSSPVVVNVLAEQDQPGSIGIGSVWTSQYQQLRFVFDAATSKVVANGANYPINFKTNALSNTTVPAGAATSTTPAGVATSTTAVSSGTFAVTVNGTFAVGSNPASAVEADFNAFESLMVNSYGNIVARTTIFAVPSALAGKISGTLLNSAGQPVSNATVVAFDANNNVANTSNTDATGAYSMHTIAAGSVHLVVYNTYKTTVGQTLSATNQTANSTSVDGGYVTVTSGQTTQVPAIKD